MPDYLHAEAGIGFYSAVAHGRSGVVRTVHIQRQADNHGFGLPLFQQFLNNVSSQAYRPALSTRGGLGGADDALPYGDANAFGAKIGSLKRSAHYACPASAGMVTISMPIS